MTNLEIRAKILHALDHSRNKISIFNLAKKTGIDIWRLRENVWDLAAADQLIITKDWKLKKAIDK